MCLPRTSRIILVDKGMPFREAHGVVARLSRYAVERGVQFEQLTLSDYRGFSSMFDEDVLAISVDSSVAAQGMCRAGRHSIECGGQSLTQRRNFRLKGRLRMTTERIIKIAPSILSADFGRLGEQVAEAEQGGADAIHIDIMDGNFVPNITMGPMIVDAIRSWTSLPFDLHMMVDAPERYIDDFAGAGADIITVHAEACRHLHRTVHQIREAGKKPSVAISPATPVSAIEEVIADLDQTLVMTVNPGFGGQAFIPSMLDKIARVRALIDERGLSTDLQVDGGISASTAASVVAAGANVLVAGSAVYSDRMTVAEGIAAIRACVSGN